MREKGMRGKRGAEEEGLPTASAAARQAGKQSDRQTGWQAAAWQGVRMFRADTSRLMDGEGAGEWGAGSHSCVVPSLNLRRRPYPADTVRPFHCALCVTERLLSSASLLFVSSSWQGCVVAK